MVWAVWDWGSNMAQKSKYHNEPTIIKFDKSVDSGPLPQDADAETQQMIQNERIRRQQNSAIYKTKKRK